MSRRERPPTLTREDRWHGRNEITVQLDDRVFDPGTAARIAEWWRSRNEITVAAVPVEWSLTIMPPQAHDIGATVCAPGHRYPLTVVAFEQAVATSEAQGVVHSVYTLQDEANPACQPFPAYRVPARDVRPYTWQSLATLSEATTITLALDYRGKYLDACAHLHDLGDHDNADELLNEAAMKWFEPHAFCGGTGEVKVDIVAGGITRAHAPVSCTDCNGTGRVSRITDAHRLRLVECLIAAGLPARAEPKPKVGTRDNPWRNSGRRAATREGGALRTTDATSLVGFEVVSGPDDAVSVTGTVTAWSEIEAMANHWRVNAVLAGGRIVTHTIEGLGGGPEWTRGTPSVDLVENATGGADLMLTGLAATTIRWAVTMMANRAAP